MASNKRRNMEKPTEAIADKIFNYFENNHQGKNWTLFLITLGLVHSAWWFATFDFIKKFGTQNPYFIFLEILFIASSITRILIAIDIFYIIANIWLCDWIMKLLWKKRRDEWRRWESLMYDIKMQSYKNGTYDFARSLLFFCIRKEAIISKEHEDRLKESFTYNDQIDYEQRFALFQKDDTFPYHIKYWARIAIGECGKERERLTKALQKNEAKNLSLTKQ